MSTHARIGIANKDNSIISIYTHSDGYPEHHGPLLLEHWNTPLRVHELMTLGSLSVLGARFGAEHDFENRAVSDECTAYGRDRGETDVGAIFSPTQDHFEGLCDDCWAEYAYLFKDGVWKVATVTGDPFLWQDLHTVSVQTS